MTAKSSTRMRCATSPSSRRRSSIAARRRSRGSRSSACSRSRCCSPTRASATSKASAQVAAVVLYPLQRAVQLPGEALAVRRRLLRVASAQLADENARAEAGSSSRRRRPRRAIAQLARRERAAAGAARASQARFAGAATAVEVLYTGRDPFAQKLFVDKGTRRRHAAGRGGDRRDRRRRPGDARVPVHGGSDAGHRQGPRGAGAGSSAAACAACSSAPARAARRSCASWRRPPTSRSATCSSRRASTAPIRRGSRWREVATVERDTGQMFARITCRPLAGVDRSQLPAGAGREAAARRRGRKSPRTPTARRRARGKGRRGG